MSLSKKSPLLLSLVFICLWSIPCSAITTGEQHTVNLCRKISRGVVNITSKPLASDFYLAPVPHRGSGSGFILDRLGHVLTNYHIICDVHSIEVVMYDGRKWPARLVGHDNETDLAVLELQAPQEELKALYPMHLSTLSLHIGQEVLALGNPFGTGYTVSQGVVSSLRRAISTPDGRVIYGIIQTDISINRGISGGPLIDSAGRVIGINTLIFTPSPQIPGLGFAIPSKTIKWVASQLISKGYLIRSWMGANLQTVTPTLARFLDFSVKKGAMVIKVIPGGPASRAGIRGSDKTLRLGNRLYPIGGDIIVGIDGKEVDSDADVIQILLTKEPGKEVLVSLYRGERLRRLRVRLEKKPTRLQLLK